MQNLITYFAPSIRTQGVWYSSMRKAPVSFIDTRDIGAFVAQLIRSDEHKGKTYELNGPEALSYDQVAGLISQATGRDVRYVDVPRAKQRQSLLGVGMPEWQAEALLELQRYYTEGGGGEVDDLFQRVVGRPPLRMAAFVREFAGEFAAAATA